MQITLPTLLFVSLTGLVLAAAAPQKSGKPDKDGTLVAGELGEELDAAVSIAAQGEAWGAVLVAKDGEVLLAKGYGKADYADVDCTPNTLFELASASKQFAAAAILVLEQKRKLKIDDPLTEFFKDVPDDKAEITLRQLMTHTSGISRELGVPYASPLARGEYVRKMLDAPLEAAPGEKHLYANVNYALLAAVIEEVTGDSFEEVLEELLFEPADMDDTGFIGDRDLIKSGRAANRLSKSGEPSDKTAADWFWGWGYRGMGGVVTTVWDVHKWDRALRGKKPLKKSSLEQMFEPALDGYACGWRVGANKRGTKTAQHAGSVAGFGANILRGLQDDYLIVVLSNDQITAMKITAACEGKLFGTR